MANILKTISHIKKWEGGWSNDKNDKGGCTMYGVTISVFQSVYGKDKTCEDLKRITSGQWMSIFMRLFWNPILAYNIANDSICTLILDMCWMSGVKTSVKKIQKVLGVKEDGILGKDTLMAINSYNDQGQLFQNLWDMRKDWLESIASKPAYKKYLKGWMNRLADIKYVEKV